MFELYKQLLPAMGGYLTHAGELNRGRLEAFMRHLAEAEADVLHARAEVGALLHAWAAVQQSACGSAWCSSVARAQAGPSGADAAPRRPTFALSHVFLPAGRRGV